MSDSEQERLKRLRERQLADRDPLVKKREFQRASVERERRAYKPVTLREIWTTIPHIWRSGFIGLLIGVAIAAALTSLWASTWALPAAIIALIFIVGMALIIGRGLDSRDDIRDNLH
jgi:uncharacterized membrane protein